MTIQCFKPALFMFCLGMLSLNAQSYRFQSTTSQYNELSGAKHISFAYMDSLGGFYRLKELDGETFKWYNTLFKLDTIKTFYIQPYANLRFDNDSSLIIVDAAFTYLDSIDASSSISYTIEGKPGDRLVKVQWKNLKAREGKAGNFVNVQIWVYQLSGVYEIHYGPSSTNNQSGFNQSTGPQVGIFYSLDNFTKCFEKLWVTGNPLALRLDSGANYNFKAMAGIPVEGVVFRFIPNFKTLGLVAHTAAQASFSVFPNPVSGGQVLYFSKPGNYRIYNQYGQELISVKDVSEISLAGLAQGMYIVRSDLGEPVRFILGNIF